MLNRKFILGISLLSGIALIGLVFIQVYWIQSAIEQRKSQFEDNVNKSLVEVVYDVDRFEAISRMNKNAGSKDLLNKLLQKGGKALHNHANYFDELDKVISTIHDEFNVQIVEKHLLNKNITCCPEFQGKGGHPLLICKNDLKKLSKSSIETPLNTIFTTKRISVMDPYLHLNIDTPNDIILFNKFITEI